MSFPEAGGGGRRGEEEREKRVPLLMDANLDALHSSCFTI
jgi:hypothetical protein